MRLEQRYGEQLLSLFSLMESAAMALYLILHFVFHLV
jgi:NAD(P)H-hydrate repair Nnr-like enzyme with NAD(P)H-hydrate epimerase domain